MSAGMTEDALESIILNTLDLPAIPMVAARVMQLVGSSACSIDDVQKVISGDPAVVSRLLRIANSPMYGGRGNIDSVESAIMMMGFDTMKNMVLASSVRQVYRHFGLFEKMSWEHSLGVSMAAGMLASKLGQRRDEAATAGLLHDIGKIVISDKMPERYAQIIESVYTDNTNSFEVETEELGFNHCDVGKLLARKWKLSASLIAAIGYHHSPDAVPDSMSEHRPLCELVNAADRICLYLGVGGAQPVVDALDGISVTIEEDVMFRFVDEFRETFVTEKLKFMEV